VVIICRYFVAFSGQNNCLFHVSRLSAFILRVLHNINFNNVRNITDIIDQRAYVYGNIPVEQNIQMRLG
jgi:hypothetical protein